MEKEERKAGDDFVEIEVAVEEVVEGVTLERALDYQKSNRSPAQQSSIIRSFHRIIRTAQGDAAVVALHNGHPPHPHFPHHR